MLHQAKDPSEPSPSNPAQKKWTPKQGKRNIWTRFRDSIFLRQKGKGKGAKTKGRGQTGAESCLLYTSPSPRDS
eukprot:1976063-Prorocentrum_lima.AAC.1